MTMTITVDVAFAVTGNVTITSDITKFFIITITIAPLIIATISTLVGTAPITTTLTITITNAFLNFVLNITSTLDRFVVEVARSATEDHIS